MRDIGSSYLPVQRGPGRHLLLVLHSPVGSLRAESAHAADVKSVRNTFVTAAQTKGHFGRRRVVPQRLVVGRGVLVFAGRVFPRQLYRPALLPPTAG